MRFARCPGCQLVVSEAHITYARYRLCPRCHLKGLNDFILYDYREQLDAKDREAISSTIEAQRPEGTVSDQDLQPPAA